MSTALKIFYCFEALPCFVGFLYWKKVGNSYFKWFVIYLLYIFLADLAGAIIKLCNFHNELYYDYFVVPIEFLFLFWLFYKTFQDYKYKRLPIIFTGTYLSSFLIDVIFFSKHPFPFYSFSYSIGNLLLLLLILRFFLLLISSDDVLQYRTNMMFWICIGLLVYYLGSFPFYGLKNNFAHKYLKLLKIYNNIALILDCIMYLMFTFSFIWGKPNSRYSQS